MKPITPSILVGTDFTSSGKIAVERAEQLALALDSRLVTVHVVGDSGVGVTSPLPGAWSAPMATEREPERHRAALRSATQVAQTRLSSLALEEGIERKDLVRFGSPHQALVVTAQREQARLIVVGVHKPGGAFERFFLGSTAERVLRGSPCPVLLARQRPKGPYRKALVPVELNDASLRLLLKVQELLPGTSLHVLHCTPLRSVAPGKAELLPWDKELRDLVQAAKLDPSLVRTEVVAREPRTGIVALARSRGFDLIAMGTHARRGVPRLLLGSVSEYVSRAAACDVMVVPPARDWR